MNTSVRTDSDFQNFNLLLSQSYKNTSPRSCDSSRENNKKYFQSDHQKIKRKRKKDSLAEQPVPHRAVKEVSCSTHGGSGLWPCGLGCFRCTHAVFVWLNMQTHIQRSAAYGRVLSERGGFMMQELWRQRQSRTLMKPVWKHHELILLLLTVYRVPPCFTPGPLCYTGVIFES